MLRTASPRYGFTLIELIITLAIAASLLMIAAPSIGPWIQNVRVRNAAEAVQNGLQFARAEALRRNGAVRFQLVTSLDGGCALSTTGTNWVVSLDDPTGQCNAATITQSSDPAPRIVQKRPGVDGSTGVTVTADRTAIVFNGLGQAAPAPARVSLTSTAAGGCRADGGEIRCLRIEISAGGQIRMCDPRIPATTPPDPQGCLQ